jgi:hypothetical protein
MAAFMALYLGTRRAEKRGRSVTTELRPRNKKSFARGGLNGFPGQRRRLSTKSVDNCVDYYQAPEAKSLQKYDIVKLVNFSPGVFSLFLQRLIDAC